MPDVFIIVYARERYRIVRFDDDAPPRYVIVDTAGAELRHELNLDDARLWVDRAVMEDMTACTTLATRRTRR